MSREKLRQLDDRCDTSDSWQEDGGKLVELRLTSRVQYADGVGLNEIIPDSRINSLRPFWNCSKCSMMLSGSSSR